MKNSSLAILLLCFSTLLYGHDGNHTATPPWQAATAWPDRIIATLSGDPTTEFAVTWRTDASVGRTIAQICPATPDARFDLAAITLRADTEQADLETLVTPEGVRHSLENVGLRPTHHHSVKFSKLQPDTLYAWRVQGGRGNWSEWFQTRTAKVKGPIEFVYFGDAQNGIRPNWSRVIRAAYQTAPRANFFLHAGDLVQKGEGDYNWAEWFTAGGFIHAQVPTLPIPGNHENMAVTSPGGKRVSTRATLWRPHFTLPIEKDLPDDLHESVYDVRYGNGLHVFAIDSARQAFDEQAAWLKEGLATSDATWKVVSMHHPYFIPTDSSSGADVRARHNAFTPVVDAGDVDLVLTGHIHTYGRSSLRSDRGAHAARLVAGEPYAVETVFVISFSGAKMSSNLQWEKAEVTVGDTTPDLGKVSVERVADNTPMFQVIRIHGTTLTYEAHMATGELYDSFTLTKAPDGTKQLTNGEKAFGDVRVLSTTGEYREWYDLR